MSRPTRAGDRARFLYDVCTRSGLVDRTLARLDLSPLADDYDRGQGRVLIREVSFGVVAHVPLWNDGAGWWLPACGADASRHAWTGEEPWNRWTLVDGPVAAAFARCCRNCRWPSS